MNEVIHVFGPCRWGQPRDGGYVLHDPEIGSHCIGHAGHEAKLRYEAHQTVDFALTEAFFLGPVHQHWLLLVQDVDAVLLLVVIHVGHGFSLGVGKSALRSAIPVDVVDFVRRIVIPKRNNLYKKSRNLG